MINSTKKCTTNWGIEGYAINANGGPLVKNPVFSFSKQKRDVQTLNDKNKAAFPAPPDHHKDINWNKANGKFLPGARKLAIEKEAEMQKYKPSPIAYNPEVKVKAKMIPFAKGERVNFLCDAEYLGKVKPGAGKYDPSFKLVKCRSTEFKYYTSKVDRTKWKPEKSDLPDCAKYKTDSADKIVYKTSQRFAAVKVHLHNIG